MKRDKSYLKGQPQIYQAHSIGFVQTFSQRVTNLKYNVSKFFGNILTNQQQLIETRCILIQGQTYNNRKAAKQAIQKIIWFSYRKGFKISNQFHSDVGWGCLVRVGQMALASAIFKFFKSQPYIRFSDQAITQSIIGTFSDFKGKQQKYSLNVIVETAFNQFGQKPGQWFNLSKISQTMRIIQNKHPMKGTQNLQVIFFDQGFNVSTLLQLEGIKHCNCAIVKIVCQQCHKKQLFQSKNQNYYIKQNNGQMKSFKPQDSFNQQISHNKSTLARYSLINKSLDNFMDKRFRRDMFILLLTRTMDNQNPQQINKAIFTLLDLKFCQGIMTGFPGKAIFVIGRQQNQLIYLDPHYVQKNTTFWSRDDDETYSCKQYHKTAREKLDRSMTFCFYLHNLRQLIILLEAIQKIRFKYPESLSLFRDNQKQTINFNDYQQQQIQQDSISRYSNFQM